MNDEPIHLDLSEIERGRLESICNTALGYLDFDHVKDILADHNVILQTQVVMETLN